MKSVWLYDVKKPEFNALNGDKTTDVLIIGGGLAGVLCGYMLNKSGIDYTVVEANEICGGITQNTTAKISYHHGAIYDKMIKRFAANAARLYIKAGQSAIVTTRALLKRVSRLTILPIKINLILKINN